MDVLLRFDGGQETPEAIHAFLDKYGMRCAGEIDITKTRWSEKPAAVIPCFLVNIKNFELVASKRKFEQGKREAVQKEQELRIKLNITSDGEIITGRYKRKTSPLMRLPARVFLPELLREEHV